MKTKMDYLKETNLKSKASQAGENCYQNLKTAETMMKTKLIRLCVMLVLFSIHLSVKAQTSTTAGSPRP